MWKWVVASIAVLFVMAGCTSGPQKTPIEQCADQACDRQPLTSSRCDKMTPQTLMEHRLVPEDDVGDLRGILSFHRGAKGDKNDNSGRCRNISWVTFAPAPGNTTPFRVIMVISAVEEREGVSVTSKLTEPVSTIGFYTGARTSVNGCVARLDGKGNKIGANACLESIPVNPDLYVEGE